MFITLFFKECKQMLKCLTYYVFLICICLFFWSQMGSETITGEPQPGQDNLGTRYSEDEDVMMRMTIVSLMQEYTTNKYSTYPFGFIKEVTLNEKDKFKIYEILSEITGLTAIEIKEITNTPIEPSAIYQLDSLTYQRFLELMMEANLIVGRGSKYSESYMKSNTTASMTYDEALKEYYEILDKDHLSRAYARLFCDYMGIALVILPVFIAVTRGLRDKRAKIKEVIQSRSGSSFTIILSRYLSMIFMMIVPVIILSTQLSLECSYFGWSNGIKVDHLAFIKYILGWLLPCVMVATSVGVFFTELTDTAIAILIQGLWWFLSISIGVSGLNGHYNWNLIPRHNILGNYQYFSENFHTLVANRITYAIFAMILVFATVGIYELKRKGQLTIYGKIFNHRKIESKI